LRQPLKQFGILGYVLQSYRHSAMQATSILHVSASLINFHKLILWLSQTLHGVK
jgi:hypothetical protein